MKFDDRQLQEHYDKVVRLMHTLPEELRPICALMDAYTWFRLTEGEDDPRVREVVRRLTSLESRPALKQWYSYSGRNINPAAVEFHDTLERLIGEKLPFEPQKI